MLKGKKTVWLCYSFFVKSLFLVLVFLCSACGFPALKSEQQVEVLSSTVPEKYFYDELEAYKKDHAERQTEKYTVWWKSFANEDLNTLQEIALKENYDVLSAYARMKQYAADASISESAFFPLVTLGASGASNHSKTKESSSVKSSSSSSDRYRLEGGASYEVDLWGRVRSAYNAEAMRFIASHEDLQTAVMTISADVAGTWAELLGNQAELAIVKEQINVNESLVKLQKVRFSNSLVSSLDVLQQEEVLAASKAELPDLLQQNLELKNSLCILLGKIPGNLPDFDLNAPLPHIMPVPDTGIPVDLLQFRPDIRAAWANVQASHYDLKEAEANRFPQLNLSFAHIFSAGSLSLLLENWTNELLASLNYTLFDAGEKYYQVEKMRARAEETLLAYIKTVAEAIAEVNNTLAQEYSQQERLSLLEKQYVMAKSATRGALNQYLKGSEDIMRFLTLLESTQDLERTIARQRVNVVQVRINLYRSLGNMYFPEGQVALMMKKEDMHEK